MNSSVKLIWSNADTADASYNTPSVFGRGLFFSIGSDDIPQPSVVIEEVPLPFIAVNRDTCKVTCRRFASRLY